MKKTIILAMIIAATFSVHAQHQRDTIKVMMKATTDTVRFAHNDEDGSNGSRFETLEDTGWLIIDTLYDTHDYRLLNWKPVPKKYYVYYSYVLPSTLIDDKIKH